MKSGRVTISLLCLIGMGMNLLEGAESKPMTITTIEGITEYRLENGFKVLLFPDESKPTVTVNLTIFVGSRHEGYGEAGMAHLLEHMLFKGTPDHPAVPKALQERGAVFNGTTWLDRTNYFETLPAKDDNLEFALKLEADRMMNSLIRAEDLASEMSVVRSEFERGENSPERILGQRMMAAAFEWHNYGKSTIGNRADIERVPVENLRVFYRKFYQPDNAMVVVAGKFDSKKALEIIAQTFGSIPRPERKLENTYTEEPAQDGERSVTLRRVGSVAVVGACYHIPAGAHPDFVPVDVLESILTMAPSGRLYKSMVEQKKAASVSGSAFALHDPGVLRFMAEVAAGNPPEAVLDTMFDTIETIVDRGVTEEEVSRAKVRLLKDWELGASDTSRIAVELSEWAAQGDWRLYFLYRDRVQKVTVDDVNRVARAYLQPNNRTVGVFIPTEKSERATIPAKPELASLLDGYKGRATESAGEAFDVSPANIEARSKRVSLAGLNAVLLPKKTRGSTVTFQLTLAYGTDKTLFGQARACEVLPLMMTRGTKQLTRQQLQDALDKNYATLSGSGDPGSATFSIKTKRENLAEVLGILKQVLREPSFPADEFNVIRQQIRADQEQQITDPQALAVKAVRRMLSPYEAGDVRYIPTVEEEVRLTDALEIAALRRLYDDFLGGNHARLVVIGDFDVDSTLTAVQSMLAGWNSKQDYERIRLNGQVQVKDTLSTIPVPDKENAVFFAGTVIPMMDTHPDYAALVVANHILGAGALSSRLGDRIRQKEGLSYGVGSNFLASSFDERATMSLYAIYNPKNVDKLLTAVNEEWTRFLENGVTDAEVEAARTAILQGLQVSRSNDGRLVGILDRTMETNRTMAFYAQQDEAIAKVTPADIQSAVKKHLQGRPVFRAISGTFATK